MSDPTIEREQRAVLVGLTSTRNRDGRVEAPLAELGRLAKTAGATVVGEVLQRRDSPDAAFFIGRGKVDEVAELVALESAEMVLFDNDLSPGQERNIEKRLGVRVIDRSRLILDIFATRARTHQATLQVELAQLIYTRSRLKRMWTHLERLEGAIGTRGPGEKQIETDRRIIDKRIQQLRRSLVSVERQEQTRAASREAYFKVSLVGYTNAGKSTLLRRLAGVEAFVEDKLFATLDTQTRAWELPGKHRVFLSDTVGFIRDLPHHLVASFHATLAEAVRADLLLHVVDASNPDASFQMDVVEEVLDEIGAADRPRLLVFNKIDQVQDGLLAGGLFGQHPDGLQVSAHTGDGIDTLGARVAQCVERSMIPMQLDLPVTRGRLLAFVDSRANVVERTYSGESVSLRIVVSERDAAEIERQVARGRGVAQRSP